MFVKRVRRVCGDVVSCVDGVVMGQLPFASGFEPSGHDVCVVEFKVFVARDFPDVVFDGDVGVGHLPLASGFEPSGHV